MDILSIVKEEVEQFKEPMHSLSEPGEGENPTTTQEYVEITRPTIRSSGQNEKPPSEEFPQLTDPTYWLSYEYQQIYAEVKKLNEKMNLILSIIEKKPRKNTITEVNSKVDSIIEKLEEKRDKKRKLGYGNSSTAKWIA